MVTSNRLLDDRRPWDAGRMPQIAIEDVVTALFVPGDRPERFAKAAAAGADLVIVDLEDAVAPEAKTAARENVRQALTDSRDGGRPGLRAAVRINALGSTESAADAELLDALVAADTASGTTARLTAVLVPKADDAEAVAALAARVPGVPLVPLIESARGLAAVDRIATVPGVVRIAFGGLDYAQDIAAAPTAETLLLPRSTLVLASRVAGIAAPLDTPEPEFRDPLPAETAARTVAALGFGGKLCIHPTQVPAVARGFAPTETQLAWAREVVAGAEAGGAAYAAAGQMVDPPVLARARALLTRAHDSA